MLHIIWYIVVGFLAGLIGRALLPGADSMGFLATTGVGVRRDRRLHRPRHQETDPEAKFHPARLLLSIVGAVVLLLVLRFTAAITRNGCY